MVPHLDNAAEQGCHEHRERESPADTDCEGTPGVESRRETGIDHDPPGSVSGNWGYFGLLPREPPPMPRIIIHIIAPIMSMQGIKNNAKASFAPLAASMTMSAISKPQPHISFIECLMP